jgi:hypothetical protein
LSAAVAWGKLPLKSLRVSMDEVSAGFVQQLTMFRHLTCLSLMPLMWDDLGTTYERETFSSAVTLSQLAAVLTQLTGLQVLALDMRRGDMQEGSSFLEGMSTGGAASGYIESVAAIVQAIGGLQQLGTVKVQLPVELDDDAVQQLSGILGQLLPSSLAASCKVGTDLLSIAP